MYVCFCVYVYVFLYALFMFFAFSRSRSSNRRCVSGLAHTNRTLKRLPASRIMADGG